MGKIQRIFFDWLFTYKHVKLYNSIQTGGGKEYKYNFDKYTFNLYIEDQDDNKYIEFQMTGTEMPCIIIVIDSLNNIAILQGLSYDEKCVIPKLPYPGGGTILLKLAIQFVKEKGKNIILIN